MMSKKLTLVFIALLFFVSLTQAARNLQEISPEVIEKETPNEIAVALGDEEGLAKSTQNAHIDYIYTQRDENRHPDGENNSLAKSTQNAHIDYIYTQRDENRHPDGENNSLAKSTQNAHIDNIYSETDGNHH